MTDFLTSTLCRGQRPRGLEHVYVKPRPALVLRLMHERQVVRFLVAPNGFGKTSLCLDYAQTVFDFQDVSWIDTHSPCFLRDLDKGIIASGVMERCPGCKLVVFDQVPLLGTARADELSRTFDEFLSSGCEVLVSATPPCDAYARRQPDRIRLGSRDLLATEEDADGETGGFRRLSTAERIPMLFFSSDGASADIASAAAHEELPNEVFLAMLSLLVVRSGLLGELCAGVPHITVDALRVLRKDYLYLGISEDLKSFDAVKVDVGELERAFRQRLDAIASFAEVSGKEDLALGFARVLMGLGHGARACETVRVFCHARQAGEWLVKNSALLMHPLCLAQVTFLFDKALLPATAGASRVMAHQALRASMMEDRATARRLAQRVLRQRAVSADARAVMLLMLSEQASGSGRQKSYEQLQRMEQEEGPSDDRVLSAWPDFFNLVRLRDNPEAAFKFWRKRRMAGCSLHFEVLGAGWLAQRGCVEAARVLAKLLEDCTYDDARSGWLAFLASRECFFNPDPEVAEVFSLAGPAVAESMNRFLGVLERQRREVFRMQELLSKEVADAADADFRFRAVAVDQPSIPLLTIKLFGGLRIFIAGMEVDSGKLNRQRARTLLGLLALDAGREIPRDRLAMSLYPDTSLKRSVNCFYTVWSTLRSALSLADGSCPYLMRISSGYMLDDKRLSLDVTRVKELCRELTLDTPKPEVWRRKLVEMESLAAGDLLPGELDNDRIASAREQLRTRIVDALLRSARCLLDQGEAGLAREFAIAAYQRERRREDVYYVNMQTAIACNQREVAISLYTENRLYLANELGIDPSARMMELYMSIISSEESF